MSDEERGPSLNDRSADEIRNPKRDRDGLSPRDADDGSKPERRNDKDATAEAMAMAGKVRSGA